MAKAPYINDEDRHDPNRIEAIIKQAVNARYLKDPLLGLLYHVKKNQKEVTLLKRNLDEMKKSIDKLESLINTLIKEEKP